MKKTIILIVLVQFTALMSLKAQLLPEVTKKYPWHILSRVLEVSTKARLPLQKQLLLAEMFKKQDSLDNVSLKNGESAERIFMDRQITKEKLATILSPFEVAQYVIATPAYEISPFSSALYEKVILKLTEAQVTKLEDANKQFKTKLLYNEQTRNSKPFSHKLFEGQQLKAILDEEQYARFLSMESKAAASKLTAETLFALKNAGLVNDKDSIEQSQKVMNYLLFKQATNLRIAHGVDYATEDSLKRNINRYKPPILIKLEAYNRTDVTTQLASAIKLRKELKLDESQVSRLADAQVIIEKKRSSYRNGNFDSTPLESSQLHAILNSQQYSDFLSLSSKKEAETYTKNTWLALTRMELTKSVDSTTACREILKYALEKAVVSAKKKNGDASTTNLDSILRVYEAKRPLLLYKLDAYKYGAKTIPVNRFAAAIKYRKEITLTDKQLDTLFKKHRDLEILRDTKKSDVAGERPNSVDLKKYESVNMLAILNSAQLKKLFQLKNYDRALELNKENWDKIKQFGLSVGLDSSEVNKQNLNYQIRLLAAREHVNFDPNPETEVYRRLVENQKPPIMEKLEIANRRKISGLETKKTFSW